MRIVKVSFEIMSISIARHRQFIQNYSKKQTKTRWRNNVIQSFECDRYVFILWLDFCHNYRNLPAAVSDQITVERIPRKPATSEASATIVVKDTKRLVEIANKSSPSTTPSQTGKKEPTLVIIDTNSILSGEENFILFLLACSSWKMRKFLQRFCYNYLTWQFDSV